MFATLRTWSTFSCDEVAFLLDTLALPPLASPPHDIIHLDAAVVRLDVPVVDVTASPAKETPSTAESTLFRCLDPTCDDEIKWPRGYCRAHGGKPKCGVHGCSRDRQVGGKCIKHGGGRRCKVPKCPRSVQTRGLCKSHGGGVRCRYPGCCNGSQGGGLCRAHGGGKRCSVAGCSKGVQKHNLCAAHGSAKAHPRGVL